jgi:ATP-binding cassette subfamily B protein
MNIKESNNFFYKNISDNIKDIVYKKYPKDEILYSCESDINRNNNFGKENLIITNFHVLCFGLTKDSRFDSLFLDLNIDDIELIRNIDFYGRAALIAKLKGETFFLAYYTQEKKEEFLKVIDIFNKLKTNKEGIEEKSNQIVNNDSPKLEENKKNNLKIIYEKFYKKSLTLLRIFEFARPYSKFIALIFIFMVFATASGLIVPYISKLFIDFIFKPDSNTHVFTYAKYLPFAILLMVNAYFLQLFFGALQERISGTLGYKTVHDVRIALYTKLHNLSLKYFDKHQTGLVLARVNQDTQDLQHLIVDFLPMALESILMLIGVGSFLCWLNLKLTIIVCIPLLFAIYFLKRIFPDIGLYFHKYFHKRAILSSIVNDVISGIRVVRAFGREQTEINRFNTNSMEYRDAGIILIKKWSIYHPIIQFLIMCGGIIVWFVGGNYVFANKMTVGSVVAYGGYLAMFYQPIFTLVRLFEMLTNSLAAADRIFEILDIKDDKKDISFMLMPTVKGEIQFKNVSFGYEKNKPVIRNLSFLVKPKEKIGLVGKSGAGKTTIINLLCRFYEDYEGEILIDGIEIRKIDKKDFNKHISIVLQENFLFNGTIYDNISYANPDASCEKIIECAIFANAHDFIITKPDGYDTLVGERGCMLSAGEKQRIAIARALLAEPAILILDEATSLVDSQTEIKIQEALQNLTKDRTTIAIAHRLSTLKNYDRLLIIDKGNIVEQGSWKELIEKKGYFYEFIKPQKDLY